MYLALGGYNAFDTRTAALNLLHLGVFVELNSELFGFSDETLVYGRGGGVTVPCAEGPSEYSIEVVDGIMLETFLVRQEVNRYGERLLEDAVIVDFLV